MQPPTEMDLISVIAAVLVVLIGPQFAPVLSAYAVIVMGWFVGLLIGLFRREPGSRVSTLMFVVVSLIITLGVSVPAASAASEYLGGIEFKSLLMPVAFAIPAIGEDWGKFFVWVWGKVKPRAGRVLGGK